MIPAQQLNIRQRKAFLICVDVASDGTLSAEGKYQVTAVKNATGDYTVTLIDAAKRNIQVVGCSPFVANLQHQVVSVSSSAVNVKFTNNSGTATDTQFHLTLAAFYGKETA